MTKQDKTSEDKRSRAWLPESTLQHLRSAREEMRAALEALVPAEFTTRRRAAKREFLLAARTIIDYALERSEAGEQV